MHIATTVVDSFRTGELDGCRAAVRRRLPAVLARAWRIVVRSVDRPDGDKPAAGAAGIPDLAVDPLGFVCLLAHRGAARSGHRHRHEAATFRCRGCALRRIGRSRTVVSTRSWLARAPRYPRELGDPVRSATGSRAGMVGQRSAPAWLGPEGRHTRLPGAAQQARRCRDRETVRVYGVLAATAAQPAVHGAFGRLDLPDAPNQSGQIAIRVLATTTGAPVACWTSSWTAPPPTEAV